MLLPPGCRFRVEGAMDAGNNLTIIQLLELPSKEWIVNLNPGLGPVPTTPAAVPQAEV